MPTKRGGVEPSYVVSPSYFVRCNKRTTQVTVREGRGGASEIEVAASLPGVPTASDCTVELEQTADGGDAHLVVHAPGPR